MPGLVRPPFFVPPGRANPRDRSLTTPISWKPLFAVNPLPYPSSIMSTASVNRRLFPSFHLGGYTLVHLQEDGGYTMSHDTISIDSKSSRVLGNARNKRGNLSLLAESVMKVETPAHGLSLTLCKVNDPTTLFIAFSRVNATANLLSRFPYHLLPEISR